MIELKVLGLAIDSSSKTPILVLQSLEGESVLPIWIGGIEAMSISMALHDVLPERPLTHDLFYNALTGLNASISSVSIVDLREGVFYSTVDIVLGDKLIQLDCRPSDAIAMALRAQVPVRATPEVMAKAPLERFKNASLGSGKVHDEATSIVQRSLKAKQQQHEGNKEDFNSCLIDASILFDQGMGNSTEEILSRLLQNLEPVSNNKM